MDKPKEKTGLSLQEKLLSFQSLINNFPIPIFYKDLKGNYLGCNLAFKQYLGLDKSDIIGKSAYDISPVDLAINHKERDQELCEKGGSQKYETAVLGADGLRHNVEFYKEVFYDEKGNKAGIIGIIFDITERKKKEELLKEARQELEIRVKVRTAEIAKINEDLRKEINERKRAEEALRESEETYRALVNNSLFGAFIIQDEKIVFVNPKMMEVMGYSQQEALNEDIFAFVHPEDKEKVRNYYHLRLTGKDAPSVYEARGIAKDGKVIYWQVQASLINYRNRPAIFVNLVDITARKEFEDKLEKSKEEIRMYLDIANVIILIIDKDSKVRLINKKGCNVLGYNDYKEIIGKDWFNTFLPKKYRNKVKEVFEELMAGKVKEFGEAENPVITRDGKEKVILWHNSLIKDPGGKIVATISSGQDITERKAVEKKIAHMNLELNRTNKKLKQLALLDLGTGVYNHRYLTEIIEAEFYRARRYAHPLSAIMMDVDYFKSINDVYGHKFGDMVLKQLATQLKKMVRKYDIIVRFGGEEFVIISPGADRSTALVLAQRLLDAVNLYNFGNKIHSVKIRMSVAVVSYPEDKSVKGMDLIDEAAEIVNKIKEKGGNAVSCSLDLKKVKTRVKVNHKAHDNVKSLQRRVNLLNKRSKENLIEAVFAFAKTIEVRDHGTGEHTERTVGYATQIAKAMNLPQEEIEHIKQAAILHDLGKIGISEDVLNKKDKLTKEEFKQIQKHTQIGVDIIRPIQFLHPIIPLILYHHERWDGKGYPGGLKGEEIPVGARIVALADVYQALTSDRPYRKAFSKDKAIEIIKNGSGSHFDPQIVNIFLNLINIKEKVTKKKRH
ncbi:MAG: PAS domain S-box protein [Candidatus Omnitrophota bacterium]|jgi:diguanylate cyclase (GGDEF)-like protein/PAS domain S-box-containing protein|nr:MAG: PAS domain S-box protein [Candidatus Omnitrophota bacterium]